MMPSTEWQENKITQHTKKTNAACITYHLIYKESRSLKITDTAETNSNTITLLWV